MIVGDAGISLKSNCSVHRFISTGIYRGAMKAGKFPPTHFRYVCVVCGQREKVLSHNRDRFERQHSLYLGSRY